MKDWTFVSFHTPDEKYTNLALRSEQSAKEVGAEYLRIEIPKCVNEIEAQLYIVPVLKQAFKDLPTGMNIVSLDCDSQIKRYPKLFDIIEEDYAVVPHISRSGHFNLGVTYLANNDKIYRMLDRWEQINYYMLTHLRHTLTTVGSGFNEIGCEKAVWSMPELSFFHLPYSYCYIDEEGHRAPNVKNPFIVMDVTRPRDLTEYDKFLKDFADIQEDV